MNLIGEVADRTCVLVDDMVDTAGTLCKAAQALKEKGASKVVAYATHAVLSGAAIDNITNSELDELIVTNSVPLSEEAKQCTCRCSSSACPPASKSSTAWGQPTAGLEM